MCLELKQPVALRLEHVFVSGGDGGESMGSVGGGTKEPAFRQKKQKKNLLGSLAHGSAVSVRQVCTMVDCLSGWVKKI